MNAVVEVRGMQFRVAAGDKIRVPLLPDEPGTKVTIDNVLLLDDGAEITVGRPLISGAAVESTVLDHGRRKKIIVFKMKRRKGYRVKKGHRQPYTLLIIDNILFPGEDGKDAEIDVAREEPVPIEDTQIMDTDINGEVSASQPEEQETKE